MQNRHQKKRKRDSEIDQKINAPLEKNHKLSECLSAFDPKTIADTVINTVQSNTQANKPHNFSHKLYKQSQFYSKPKEPQLVPGTNGSLKPDTDCNYCNDLGYIKLNFPKLKAKEARLAGQQNHQKSKQKKPGRARSGNLQPGPLQAKDHARQGKDHCCKTLVTLLKTQISCYKNYCASELVTTVS